MAVEYLLKTPVGCAMADLTERTALIAPELLDAEVLSALCGAVLGGRPDEALAALDDLADWPLDRIPNRALARLVWRHLHNVSAYDAFYVVAARAHNATLLTADGRLSRAPRFRAALEREARDLHSIGNNLQIRHSETNQERLVRGEHVDYLFHPLLGLIQMVLRTKD